MGRPRGPGGSAVAESGEVRFMFFSIEYRPEIDDETPDHFVTIGV
jgi:hypothetical protein